MKKQRKKQQVLEETAQLLACDPKDVPARVRTILNIVQQPWAVVAITFHPDIDALPVVAYQGLPPGKPGLRLLQRKLLAVVGAITDTLDRLDAQEQAVQEVNDERDTTGTSADENRDEAG